MPLTDRFTPLAALMVAVITSLLSGSTIPIPAKEACAPTVAVTVLPALAVAAVLAVLRYIVWVVLSKPSVTVTVTCEFPEALATKRSLANQAFANAALPVKVVADTPPVVLTIAPELGVKVIVTASPLASATVMAPKLVCAPEPALAILAFTVELGALIVGALLFATVNTLPLNDQDCAWESTLALGLNKALLSMRIYSAPLTPCTPK